MSTTYQVKAGDSFNKLAKKYHGTTMPSDEYKAKLIKLNGTKLTAGKNIELPWSTTPKPKPPKVKPKSKIRPKTTPKKKVVKKGKKKVIHETGKKSNCKRCEIDKYGFICQVGNKKIIKKQYIRSEHGSLKKVDALILHRTNDSKISWGQLNKLDKKGKKAGVAAHFYVEKDGRIYQVASLKKITWHIGGQRRCRAAENTAILLSKKYYLDIDTAITDSELKKFMKGRYSTNIQNNTVTNTDKKMTKNCLKLYPKIVNGKRDNKRMKKVFNCIGRGENSKKYPNKYPSNSSAIGIEVVGKCTNRSKGTWESVTQAQAKSIALLYDCLTKKYKLTRDDIYTHEQIAHKTLHEGTYVWNAIKTLIRKDHQ